MFAALAAAIALVLFLHERSNRMRDELDIIARQARLIVLQIELEDEYRDEDDLLHSGVLSLRNFSEGVITNISWAYRRNDGGIHSCRSTHSDYLMPGGSARSSIVLEEPLKERADAMPSDLFDVVTCFTDANGRQWLRQNRGQPIRFPSPSPKTFHQWLHDGVDFAALAAKTPRR